MEKIYVHFQKGRFHVHQFGKLFLIATLSALFGFIPHDVSANMSHTTDFLAPLQAVTVSGKVTDEAGSPYLG